MKISLSQAKPIFSLVVLIVIFGTLLTRGQTPEPFSIDSSPLAAPTSPVMDYAGVIDQATISALEKRVIDFKNATGVELGVAVVRTTGDRPIFDYSLAVARGWGIGSKEDDNPGALLFVAIDDRKYFTQVSRNLEDELPDGLVGSLQRQYLVPEFKKGNYAKGISDTIEAYIRTIEAHRSGTAAPTPSSGIQSDDAMPDAYALFCCLAVILVIILIAWSSRGGGGGGKTRDDQDRWGGGGFGSALPWIIGSVIANSGGGGSSSSDWGSGGGSDWGGFGGGGDFGGGGAGGDW
ncbi:MAG: YgcG family protein [Pyrinomonadaceae bacterium]